MHLIERDDVSLDEEGLDLPNVEAARATALKGIRDIIAEEIRSGVPVDLDRHIAITGEDGRLLAKVLFSEALVFIQAPKLH